MNENKDIKKEILNKINDGEVSMKPKVFFILKSFAVAFALIIASLLSLFIFSFIVFALKGSGAIHLGAFGGKGLVLLMFAIPWLLVFAILALVLLLEVLAKHFSFVYRKPAIYSTLGILLIIVFAGSLLAATPMHTKINERAYFGEVPFGGGEFYKRYGALEFEGGKAGRIESISTKGLVILTPKGETIIISTTTDTRYPKFNELVVGEHVIAIGEEMEDVLVAEWIKPLRGKNSPLVDGPRGMKNPPLVPIFDNLK